MDAARESDAPTYAEAFPALGGKAAAPAAPVVSGVPHVRSSNVTEMFRIPYEEQKYKTDHPFSQKDFNKILKETIQATGAKISASNSRDKTLTLTVTGSRSQVNAAKKTVLPKLQTQASIDVSIPKEYHRYIIGTKGAVRKEIEDKHACRISIPKTDDPSPVIKVVGTTEGCRAAAAAIQKIADEKDKFVNIDLPVLKAYHPLLAGYERCNVNRIMETTGVKIFIPSPNVDRDEIGVSGEKEAVQEAVRQLQAIYQELRRTCGELTAKVARDKHRFVIGIKGAFLKEIMEKTGVVVEVPPPDKEDETLILRGEQPRLVHALTMVYERANSVDLAKLDVPGWLHRRIIGKGGANVQAIAKEMPKVHINFESEKDLIEIEGPTAEVAAVKQKISTMAQQLAATLSYVDIEVDQQYHGHIVGVRGANIRQIQDETGCEINMQRDSDVIRVEGTPQAVAAGRASVEALVQKVKNQRNIDIIVPTKWHSQIIGANGARLNELRVNYPDLSINFPSRDSGSEIISVRGDKTAVDAADQWFKKTVKQIEAENYQEEVAIFRRFHSEIIGKGGAAIRKLRDEHNVRIDVPKAEEESDIILVTGLQANVQAAADAMRKIQASIANIVKEDVTVPQKLHPFISGPNGSSVRGIQDEYEVSIRVPFPKEKSDTITVSGPSENVPKAVAKLKQLIDGGVDNIKIVEMKVEAKHHRFLIGKGGAFRKQIEADSGLFRLAFPSQRTESKEDPNTVTLIGTPAAIEKAKAQIEQRVKELESVVDKSVELDSTYFKDMLARRAAFLQDLAQEFPTCHVKVPRPDAEGNCSNTVNVRGSPGEVDAVIERLQDFIHRRANAIEKGYEVAADNLPSLMGTKGVHIQRIQKECQVSIQVPDRSQRTPDQTTVEMKISGLPEDVERAIAEFEALTPVLVEYDLPAEYHRFIIGEKGADISAFQSTYDVRLEIPKPAEARDSIGIRGTPAAIENAKQGLKELMPKLEDLKAQNYTMTMEVPASFHVEIIGRNGANVKKLRAEYDVRVDFPRKEGSDEVTLRGYKEKCEACAAAIQAQVDKLNSYIIKPVNINSAIHRRIIGPKGANLRKLEEKFSVSINMPRDRDSDLIEVMGNEPDVDACIDDLLELQDELEDDIVLQKAHTKPARSEPKAKSQPKAFAIREAPWSGSSDASFPTLGEQAAPTSAMGVWATRK